MGAADIWLSYNKNVVVVDSVSAGNLGSVTTGIDNANGVTKMNWFDAAGKTGDFVFAYVVLHAVGAIGNDSILDIELKEMTDTSFTPISSSVTDGTFRIPDTTPPYTSGHNPADGTSGVPVNTNIVVHVQDDGSGVNQATIAMTVEGAAVTPTITGSASDYTLTYNPAADFGNLQVVNVTINASDLDGNAMTQDAYSFTTAGLTPTPPYTSGHNPADGTSGVPVNTNIVVHVQDDGSGVNQATIAMTVEGAAVTPTITGSASDYTLTYNPAADFGNLQVVNVTINASLTWMEMP